MVSLPTHLAADLLLSTFHGHRTFSYLLTTMETLTLEHLHFFNKNEKKQALPKPANSFGHLVFRAQRGESGYPYRTNMEMNIEWEVKVVTSHHQQLVHIY